MKKLLAKHRRALIALLVLSLVTISSTAAYVYFSNSATSTPNSNTPEVLAAAQLPPPPDDLAELTVLLLGYGGPGHQGGYLSDVIQLVHVDFEAEKVALISIPRDLWVPLPNNSAAKINQAFTLGGDKSDPVGSGGQIAKEMAQTVTGLSVDYFMAVDFVGFKRLVGENLKGIEVTVPETLDDPWYPITGEELNTCGMSPEKVAELSANFSGFELERQFPCRYKHVYFPTGNHSMQGEEALEYVRSRHGSAGGDFSRSQRQHALLKGVRERIFSLEIFRDIPAIYHAYSQNVTTDLSLEAAEYIAPALRMGKDFETKSVVFSTENVLRASKSASGQSILVPKASANNWSELQDYLKQELAD